MGSNDVRDMSEDVEEDSSSSEEPSGSEEEVRLDGLCNMGTLRSLLALYATSSMHQTRIHYIKFIFTPLNT